jgi:hypothetical protein
MDVNKHEKLFTITLRNSDCVAIQLLTDAVGYSKKSKIRTRIRNSKKDKENPMTNRKGQKDKQRSTKHTHK